MQLKQRCTRVVATLIGSMLITIALLGTLQVVLLSADATQSADIFAVAELIIDRVKYCRFLDDLLLIT